MQCVKSETKKSKSLLRFFNYRADQKFQGHHTLFPFLEVISVFIVPVYPRVSFLFVFWKIPPEPNGSNRIGSLFRDQPDPTTSTRGGERWRRRRHRRHIAEECNLLLAFQRTSTTRVEKRINSRSRDLALQTLPAKGGRIGVNWSRQTDRTKTSTTSRKRTSNLKVRFPPITEQIRR